MKKILIGCGCLFVLIVTIMIGCFIYVGLKVKHVADGVQAGVQKIEALDRKYPFQLPDGVVFDPTRLEQYFNARAAAFDAIGADPTLSKLMDASKTGKAPSLGLLEMMQFMARVGPESLNAFHDALDVQRMSPTEYAYYAELVYTTIANSKENGEGRLAEIYDKLEAVAKEINAIMAQNKQAQQEIDFEATLKSMSEAGAQPNFLVSQAVLARRDQFLERPHLSVLEMALISQFITHRASTAATFGTSNTSGAAKPDAVAPDTVDTNRIEGAPMMAPPTAGQLRDAHGTEPGAQPTPRPAVPARATPTMVPPPATPVPPINPMDDDMLPRPVEAPQ
jgi:hypothetical protein